MTNEEKVLLDACKAMCQDHGAPRGDYQGYGRVWKAYCDTLQTARVEVVDRSGCRHHIHAAVMVRVNDKDLWPR